MLIGFIGAPCSGKTTVAAKLFAELKDMGFSAEYVAEKARTYIARQRLDLQEGRYGNAKVILDDEDQLKIARSQFAAELLMNEPNVIVVSDSSVLNAMLYMTESYLQEHRVKTLMEQSVSEYDLLFICAPIQRPSGLDPNRIHDERASALAHARIETVVMPLLAEKKVILLGGDSRQRLADAMSHTLSEYTFK